MKNTSLLNIAILSTALILFVLGVIIYKYFYNQNLNSLQKITSTHELNLAIQSIKIDHGVIFINNEYYISNRIQNTSDEIYSLKDLPENSQLMKKQDSDSIFISSDGQSYLTLVLKKE